MTRSPRLAAGLALSLLLSAPLAAQDTGPFAADTQGQVALLEAAYDRISDGGPEVVQGAMMDFFRAFAKRQGDPCEFRDDEIAGRAEAEASLMFVDALGLDADPSPAAEVLLGTPQQMRDVLDVLADEAGADAALLDRIEALRARVPAIRDTLGENAGKLMASEAIEVNEADRSLTIADCEG